MSQINCVPPVFYKVKMLTDRFYGVLFYLHVPVLLGEASSESQQSASDAP